MKKTGPKIILILALIIALINVLRLDFDNLSNFEINSSQYLGIISMLLTALAMYLTIKDK